MTVPMKQGSSHSYLLRQQRFLPYFITQFFGAFNDNIFKNTLLLLVAFSAADNLPVSSTVFINLAAGVFILPFFLFSASAGIMADQVEKSALIRKIKLAEIIIMLVAAIGFILHNYILLLLLLFLMGAQSSVFGPVKYALLPQHLKPQELIKGNALVETGTFLAILLGTLLAGIITSLPQANWIAAITVVILALFGFCASVFIPPAQAVKTGHYFQWRPLKHTYQTLSLAHQDKLLLHAIWGISWFWLLGACYLTQFPNYTKLHLHGNESAVSFLLALFSIGIALGSLLCGKISAHKIRLSIVLVAAIGISLSSFLLAYFSLHIRQLEPVGFLLFIVRSELWPVFISLFTLGICGGLFIVPLYALLQYHAAADIRAQIIAANNIYNALFMVLSAIIAIIFLSLLAWSIPQMFALLGAINALMAILLAKKLRFNN